jgi:transposase
MKAVDDEAMWLMVRNSSPQSQTTVEQRRLLFRIWEQTRSVLKACKTARVSRGTFYYWKPRFDANGYTGLDEFESRVPHKPWRTPDHIVQQVIEIRLKNPTYGKHQIAKELAKVNPSVPPISANTVRRILIDGELWNTRSTDKEQENL